MYKVYVVDDDKLLLDEIVNAVPWMDNGFEVVGFSHSPVTAIKEIPELAPDLVFSDLKMPGMDGIEMIQELKDVGVESEYVLLSAHSSFEDSRRFFRTSGFDYLLKPLQHDEVQITLERLSENLAKKNPIPVLADNISPSFSELIKFVNEKFDQKHTLESLSKRFGINPNYICNLFSKNYNTTLTRYITDLRMAAVVQAMRVPGRSFKEIAVDSGYTDYYYFCKVFKSYYGVSPSNYKKNLDQINIGKS
ncbi:MAG: response regulator [Eubacteriales bacterium]